MSRESEIEEAQRTVDEALGRGPLSAMTWVLLLGTGFATLIGTGLLVALALMGRSEGRVMRAVLMGGGGLVLGAIVLTFIGWEMIAARWRSARRARDNAGGVEPKDRE